MASHIGIFGNTGSGKSYTLAKLYNSILKEFLGQGNFLLNANFLFFDFNGEYIDVESKAVNDAQDNVIIEEEFKNIYELTTRSDSINKYPISKESMKEPTIWRIIFEATEKTQTLFLNRVLKDDFLEKVSNDDARLRGYALSLVKEALNNKTEISIIYNYLEDLYDSLENHSENIKEVLSVLRRRLNFNGTTNSFYLKNETVYQGEDRFEEAIDTILDPIEISTDQLNIVNSIYLKIILKYYDEIIKGYSDQSHIGPLIKRVKKRISDLDKIIEIYDSESETRETMQNITIVSLKDVNIQMRKIIPLIICKEIYENHKKLDDRSKYLNIIVDEAHNILSSMSERESQIWKDYRLETFEEIIKEGRKFGVFLTIASQRPYDISPTIISQLHNYFLHRLINTKDIQAIERTVSYLDKVSFDSLSILPTGTCIIAGTVSQLPVIVEIDEIEDKYKPFNQTIRPLDYWIDENE
jgi:DNA helicase HerA-like ATPase